MIKIIKKEILSFRGILIEFNDYLKDNIWTLINLFFNINFFLIYRLSSGIEIKQNKIRKKFIYEGLFKMDTLL